LSQISFLADSTPPPPEPDQCEGGGRGVVRVPSAILHVPAERCEEGIEELAAELRFVVLTGKVCIATSLEALDEIL